MSDAVLERETVSESRTDGAEPHIPLVCFVCTGNTCRSPMAAALLNHMALNENAEHPRFRACSAGLMANEGEPMSSGALGALERAGIGGAHSLHSARTVTEELMANCDRVIGISSRHAMALMQAFPQYAGKISALPRDISDPFGGDSAIYDECLHEIADCIRELFGFERN